MLWVFYCSVPAQPVPTTRSGYWGPWQPSPVSSCGFTMASQNPKPGDAGLLMWVCVGVRGAQSWMASAELHQSPPEFGSVPLLEGNANQA